MNPQPFQAAGHGDLLESLRVETPMEVPGEGHPDWRPLRTGLRMRVLFDGNDGYRVALLHYKPGAMAPRRRHLARGGKPRRLPRAHPLACAGQAPDLRRKRRRLNGVVAEIDRWLRTIDHGPLTGRVAPPE